MSNFRQVDRETGFLLLPSVDEWLPERHLARFVVEVIERLDLSAMVKAYRGSGSASYHPSMLLGLLVYGYATGVFSCRQLERATYDSVAFRFIAANDHPDHDTIATFRRRFLREIEGLFVQVLMLAREAGVLKLGTVALDGTKVHANASRHSALSYEHASKLEAQLKAEIKELMALAEAADSADAPDGMSVPQELARREERLARIAEAKAKIEARAKERFAREQADHEAKMRARAEKARKTGRKPGGRPPQPPTAGPGAKDQVNLTDEDSRIMPGPGGGFEQAYNAQAAVATGSLLVVANDVVQAANDKEQIAPTLAALAALPEALGKPEAMLADTGYFSNANVTACAAAKIAPLIALGRERHNLSWQDRFAKAPPAPDNPTPLKAMAHRLASPEGRQLYALRKQTPEPVFGIIKSVMGFRQFSLRGLEKVKGEWNLVTMAWNVKPMFALAPA
ncbi:IS1182 family transposase [Mesorhizobium sp. STM 4661]|uniref:IS1182 family transposase n=1 Tax=Mesorhizobium sp. STM 4661 TaxID=1297570 RepID=UPI0002BE0762|nr:IS1182 family transposase [Mesorhizobium sp. STM 4661]CCV14384.1 transposase [Mesorhizobium sp. STM 4661]